MALTLVGLVLVAAAAGGGSQTFSYADGSTMTVALVGEGDVARVTVVPKGANEDFPRYQGFINATALKCKATFTVSKGADSTTLSRPGWSIAVSHINPTAALSIGGVVVSADVAPAATVLGKACDPPGWTGLAPDIATSVARGSGKCLRAVRSLSPAPLLNGLECCTAYQDPANKGHHPTGPCTLACPTGQTVQAVRFANYGTPKGTCGRFKVDDHCSATNFTGAITKLFEQACLGKPGCSVKKDLTDFGDPCPGTQTKHLSVSVICGGGPPPPPPPPPGPGSTGVVDEHIFGFGQTVTPGLDSVGSTKFIATFSRTLDTGPSHAPAPSYISIATKPATNASLSHGFFLNTHGYSAFDVGANNPEQLWVSSPDPILDYFLFAGPTPAAVVGQFANTAGGRISLPPSWAMGMKYDPAEGGDNATFVKTVIEEFAARGIRPDRAILEPAWQGTQYNWNTAKFPDVPAFIKSIAPTKLILWEHPILDVSTAFYAQLNASNCIPRATPTMAVDADTLQFGAAHYVGPSATQFSDLTLLRCQDVWKRYQLDHAIKSGALGFKLDEDDVDTNVGFNDSVVFPSGFHGFEFHNIQGYIWQRLYHEMFESLGQRTWLQSRGGYAGTQAYPTNSYSDGYDYPTYVRGVVNSGFSGLIWAPEMRHATCTPDHSAEDHADFARRAQLMFLSPQAQYNAWDGRDGTTVWPCGDDWLAMFKRHYDLRAGLHDYLFSAFEKQSRTGIPVARPLVLDSPGDKETWSIDDQYLLGDALMFPPAAMSSPTDTSRRVYFPRTAGSWHLWFDNTTTYAPGTWATVLTPIMIAPLFVKGGVPVPFRSADSRDGEKATAATAAAIELVVWAAPTAAPTAPCTAFSATDHAWTELYDDDGETTRYKLHAEYWRARAGFASCAAGSQLSLRFELLHSGYATTNERVEWRVRQVSAAPSHIDCGDGLQGVEWSFDPDLQQLRVPVPIKPYCACTVHF